MPTRFVFVKTDIMKRNIIISFLLVVATLTGNAKKRTESQILLAAKQAFATNVENKQMVNGQSRNNPKILKQETQLSLVGYEDGIFVVIANDDTFNAVLGYSDGNLIGSIPPALQWWIDTMNASLEKILADESRQTIILPEKYKTDVGSLVSSQWDQSEPYYNKCPEYSPYTGATNHYVTGCVATAMAQIMNFHKYPEKGKATSHSYVFYPNGEGQTGQSTRAYFGVKYDWANMLDRYSKGNYNETQANAVATLMFHCGVSVNMQYNTSANGGSGAYSSDAALALRNYFSYSTKLYHRDYFPVKEWMNIIYEEIDAGRPIEYGGNSSSGGHAFVFDGYNADGLVHVNWGWSGSGDGYFDIATLNGYSSGQDMIIIHPLDDPSNEIPYTSLWGLEEGLNVTVDRNGSITYKTTGIYNFDIEDFSGVLAFVAEPVNGGEMAILSRYSASNVPYLIGYKNYDGTASISDLADGTYRLYLASKSERETEWQPIRSHEDETNNYILTISGNDVTLQTGDSNWTASGIAKIETGGSTDGIVRVYTTGGIMVYSAPADKFNINSVPATGLLIIKDGEKVRKAFKN